MLSLSPSRNLMTSSSPPMSSSPLLSLSDIFKRPLTTKPSGNRATLIPNPPNATFTNMSTSLQDARNTASGIGSRAPVDLDGGGEEEKPAAKPKTRKLRVKKGLGSDEVPDEKPARRKKADPKPADETTVVNDKPTRKPRAKKVESKTQPMLPNAHVTKPVTNHGKEPKASVFDIATVTDTRESLQGPVPDIPADSSPSHPRLSTPLLPKSNFPLMNNIALKNEESSRQEGILNGVEFNVAGRKKRKWPEVKDGAGPKPKAPRKKPKTITDQATAAYVTNVSEAETLKRPGAITDFFGYKSKNLADAVSISKPAQFKAGDKRHPILLSPESAMKDVNNQDIIFGTLSQLAREDSPTLLRDLHQAMKESNSAGDDLSTDLSNDSQQSTTTSLRIQSRVGKSNLWAASSRDQSGRLMDVEVVDLSTTPVANVKSKPAHRLTDEPGMEPTRFPPSILDLTNPTHILAPSIVKTVEPVHPAKNAPIDHVKSSKTKPAAQKPKLSTKRGKAKTSVPAEKPDYSTYTMEELSKAVDAYGFKAVKRRNAMLEILSMCWESRSKANPSHEVAEADPMLTTKPLEQPGPSVVAPVQIAPIKKPRGRPKRVAESVPSSPISKRARRKSTTPTATVDSDSEDTPLILRRTLPKLQSTKAHSVALSDSDTAPPPSPRRRKPSKARSATPSDSNPSPPLSPRRRLKASRKKTSPAPLDATDPQLPNAEAPADLFAHITRAIKAAPPSTRASAPTWHEKMLLYDPIVLEDLTIWLNTGGLGRVGWDGEVCPAEVKAWCEGRSVCCLMRENLKGGARSRY